MTLQKWNLGSSRSEPDPWRVTARSRGSLERKSKWSNLGRSQASGGGDGETAEGPRGAKDDPDMQEESGEDRPLAWQRQCPWICRRLEWEFAWTYGEGLYFEMVKYYDKKNPVKKRDFGGFGIRRGGRWVKFGIGCMHGFKYDMP